MSLCVISFITLNNKCRFSDHLSIIPVSDFTQQLSQVYEHHGEALQTLVSTFRKRNSDLRKERWVSVQKSIIIRCQK